MATMLKTNEKPKGCVVKGYNMAVFEDIVFNKLSLSQKTNDAGVEKNNAYKFIKFTETK